EREDVGEAENIRDQQYQEHEYHRTQHATAGWQFLHLLRHEFDFLRIQAVDPALRIQRVDAPGDQLLADVIAREPPLEFGALQLQLFLLHDRRCADHAGLGRWRSDVEAKKNSADEYHNPL